MKRTLIRTSIAVVWCVALGASLYAAGTTFWRMETYADFARGRFTGVSLSREGKLSLAPRLDEVFASNQALVWAAAQDAAGNVYLGTGHQGKVYRVDAQLKTTEFFDAPEPDIFALAVDRDNNVYAGASPDGKVYRIGRDGKSTEFFDPKAKYIWSLAVGDDGALYVGTGDRGRIYRVTADGQGQLFYDTNQAHVMSLALTGERNVIAGTAPNGLLFRISPAGKGFVLYDAPLAEIHSVALAADGTILASAMAASPQRGPAMMWPGAPGVPMGPAASVSITVQASTENEAAPALPGTAATQGERPPGDTDQQLPDPGGQAPDKAARDAAAAAAGATVPLPAVDFPAGTRSAIYRVGRNDTVETIWSSNDESVYDVLPSRDTVLFSTDESGRIYELTADKRTTLLAQTNEEQTTRLLARGADVLAATANQGKLFRMGTAPGARGEYESPVRDTQSTSRWGKLIWRGTAPDGARIEFQSRTGNSSVPDNTWSDWSPTRPAEKAAGSGEFSEQITSPPARYLQWKAVLHAAADGRGAAHAARAGENARTAVLEEVAVAYLPHNRAPVINSLTVSPSSSAALPAVPAPAGAASAGSFEPMVVVVDDGGASNKSSTPQVSAGPPGAAFPGRGGASLPTIVIAWQAEDPDNDRLTYAVSIRGEGESQWKLLKDNIREMSFQPEPERFPDGKYQVRVAASDAESNPRETARTAEHFSAPFIIDNTPPVVRAAGQQRQGASAEVRFEVSDAASVLQRAEYSVNAGPWAPVFSEDGIVDSRDERFVIRLDGLAAGEHVVLLRAYDSGGNAGIGKAILK